MEKQAVSVAPTSTYTLTSAQRIHQATEKPTKHAMILYLRPEVSSVRVLEVIGRVGSAHGFVVSPKGDNEIELRTPNKCKTEMVCRVKAGRHAIKGNMVLLEWEPFVGKKVAKYAAIGAVVVLVTVGVVLLAAAASGGSSSSSGGSSSHHHCDTVFFPVHVGSGGRSITNNVFISSPGFVGAWKPSARIKPVAQYSKKRDFFPVFFRNVQEALLAEDLLSAPPIAAPLMLKVWPLVPSHPIKASIRMGLFQPTHTYYISVPQYEASAIPPTMIIEVQGDGASQVCVQHGSVPSALSSKHKLVSSSTGNHTESLTVPPEQMRSGNWFVTVASKERWTKLEYVIHATLLEDADKKEDRYMSAIVMTDLKGKGKLYTNAIAKPPKVDEDEDGNVHAEAEAVPAPPVTLQAAPITRVDADDDDEDEDEDGDDWMLIDIRADVDAAGTSTTAAPVQRTSGGPKLAKNAVVPVLPAKETDSTKKSSGKSKGKQKSNTDADADAETVAGTLAPTMMFLSNPTATDQKNDDDGAAGTSAASTSTAHNAKEKQKDKEDKEDEEARLHDGANLGAQLDQHVPDDFICPITFEIMTDPVTLQGDGHSYERKAVQRWLLDHDTSPMTGAKLAADSVVLPSPCSCWRPLFPCGGRTRCWFHRFRLSVPMALFGADDVTATIVRCVALDAPAGATAFHEGIDGNGGTLAVACGKAALLFDGAMDMVGKLGRVNGGVHQGDVQGLSFSADGKHVLSCGGKGKLVLWDVQQRAALSTLVGHSAAVNEAYFAQPTNKAADDDDDYDDDEKAHGNGGNRPGGEGGVEASASASNLRTDDTVSVSGGAGGSRRQRGNVSTRWAAQRLRVPPVFSCSADGAVLAWQVRRRAGVKPQRAQLRQGGEVTSMHLTADARYMATGSLEGSVAIWDVSRGHTEARLLGLFRADATHDDVRPMELDDLLDMDPVAFAKRVQGGSAGQQAHAAYHAREAEAETGSSGTGSAVKCVRFSPSAQYLAVGCVDNVCRMFNVTSFSRGVDFPADYSERVTHDRGLIDVARRELGLVDEPQDVPLDIGRRAVLVHEFFHDGFISAVCFSADERMVVTASVDCTCKMWDTETGRLLFQINLPVPINHMLMTSAGYLIASCGDRVLVVEVVHPRSAFGAVQQHNRAAHAQPWNGLGGDHAEGAGTGHGSGGVAGWAQGVRQQDSLLNIVNMQFGGDTEEVTLPFGTNMFRGTFLTTGGARGGLGAMMDGSGGGGADGDQPVPFFSHADLTKHAPMLGRERQRLIKHGLTFGTFRRFVAHGTIPPWVLAASLIKATHGTRPTQLVRNLQRFPLQATQLLAALAKSAYRPTDVLRAMSYEQGSDRLFQAIMHNKPIHHHMIKLGYEPIASELSDALLVIKLSPMEVDDIFFLAVKAGQDMERALHDNMALLRPTVMPPPRLPPPGGPPQHHQPSKGVLTMRASMKHSAASIPSDWNSPATSMNPNLFFSHVHDADRGAFMSQEGREQPGQTQYQSLMATLTQSKKEQEEKEEEMEAEIENPKEYDPVEPAEERKQAAMTMQQRRAMKRRTLDTTGRLRPLLLAERPPPMNLSLNVRSMTLRQGQTPYAAKPKDMQALPRVARMHYEEEMQKQMDREYQYHQQQQAQQQREAAAHADTMKRIPNAQRFPILPDMLVRGLNITFNAKTTGNAPTTNNNKNNSSSSGGGGTGVNHRIQLSGVQHGIGSTDQHEGAGDIEQQPVVLTGPGLAGGARQVVLYADPLRVEGEEHHEQGAAAPAEQLLDAEDGGEGTEEQDEQQEGQDAHKVEAGEAIIAEQEAPVVDENNAEKVDD